MLPPCSLLRAMVRAHPRTRDGGCTTAMYANKAIIASLKIRNEFLVLLKTKLNFELSPLVRDSAGDDARSHGLDLWRRQYRTEQPCSFVCLSVCRIVSHETNTNPSMEIHCGVAGAGSRERDHGHDRKASGAPLVLVLLDATFSNHIYFKNSQSNQESFFLAFLFQKQ